MKAARLSALLAARPLYVQRAADAHARALMGGDKSLIKATWSRLQMALKAYHEGQE